MSLDLILRIIIASLALIVAIMISYNKGRINLFAGGFFIVFLATALDFIDGLMPHFVFNVGSKFALIIGLEMICWIFYKRLSP